MNLFVTGTDTGVGKTVVAAGLAVQLGYNYWKPIQSGALEPRSSDTHFVSEIIGQARTVPEVYRLKQPLSPHQAAQIDGIEIDLGSILKRQPHNATVIEGAGGVLVPLNDRKLMVDLMQALNCPIILVARATLGTINHTLLTLEALRSRSLHRLAVVVVGEPHPANSRAIEKYGDVPVIAEIPMLNEFSVHSLSHAFAQINTLKLENLFHA